jgi:general secretion pathway protein K
LAPESRERGAALLTVLLLVAVISVLAATALERLRLSRRSAGNAAVVEQGRAYANAAETLALTRITGVLARDPDRVTAAGGWIGQPFGLPLPGGGVASARVSDGGNCFNLNGLVLRAPDGTLVSSEGARTQFARLMRLVGIPPQVADQVAAGAADWIDADDNPLPQGAEDRSYLALETPYRTAGTLMADRSELRAVAGVTPDVYARVRPWVCTLPVARAAQVNVNTLLPEQAPLFAMLYPDTLSVDSARQILLRRPPTGYGDPSGFLNQTAAFGATIAPDAQGQVGVKTRWFALRIDVQLGGASVQEQALVDASTLPARLVVRQWGEPS